MRTAFMIFPPLPSPIWPPQTRSQFRERSNDNGADGIGDIEGKVARVATSECGQRASFNGANGNSDIEGKATRVAASELGGERVSIARQHAQIALHHKRLMMQELKDPI